MQGRPITGFGPRLTKIRKSRGLTQTELGKLVGLSKRMVVYYEKEEAQPPGAILVDLARALKVTTDELLGMSEPKEYTDPKEAKLMKRLEKVKELPIADQRAVLKYVDALFQAAQKQVSEF